MKMTWHVPACTAVLSMGIAGLVLQTAAAQNGPTMEQTVEFINSKIPTETLRWEERWAADTADGQMHTLQLSAVRPLSISQSCHIAVPLRRVGFIYATSLFISDHQDGVFDIDLTTSDPMKLEYKKQANATSPVFAVAIPAKTHHDPLTVSIPVDYPGEMDRENNYFVFGRVQAMDANSVTVLNYETNTPMTFKAPGRMGVGNYETIAVGDYVSVQLSKYKDLSNKQPKPFSISNFNKFADQNIVTLYFKDADSAERVAKALIHASAMCYKVPASQQKKPELF